MVPADAASLGAFQPDPLAARELRAQVEHDHGDAFSCPEPFSDAITNADSHSDSGAYAFCAAQDPPDGVAL